MIGIAIVVPCLTAWLCYEAEHNWIGITTAFIMPFVAIYAFLLTPMTPPEDPTEPQPFSPTEFFETNTKKYLPAVNRCYNSVGDCYTGAKEAASGAVGRVIGTLLAPFAAQIAKGIQLGMGFSAVFEVRAPPPSRASPAPSS